MNEKKTLQLENVQMKLVLMQRNKRKVGGYELVLLVRSPFCERDFFVLINKKICDCRVAQTLLIGFYPLLRHLRLETVGCS